MTSGSDVKDYRVLINTPIANNQLVGSYWSRVWSGGDRPKTTPPTITYHRDKHSDWLRRDWQRAPKRARDSEHAYSMQLRAGYNALGSIGDIGKPQVPVSWEWCYGSYVASWPWTSNDDLAVLGKLRNKVAGSDFNAAVSLAEANQSLGLIISGAQRVAKVLHYVNKGNFVAASRVLTGNSGRKVKKAASNWLELQYGIKPLLNDVYDAAQSLAHFTSTPVKMVHTAHRKVNGTVTTASTFNAVWSTSRCYKIVKIKAIIREINVPQLFGLTDPASVAWEKLPYSFVADWFIPIGSYLAARGLAQSISGTFVTTTMKVMECRKPVLTKVAATIRIMNGFDSVYYRHIDLDRTVSTSLNVRMPSVKPLSQSATWGHAANAVALVVTAGTFGKR